MSSNREISMAAAALEFDQYSGGAGVRVRARGVGACFFLRNESKVAVRVPEASLSLPK